MLGSVLRRRLWTVICSQYWTMVVRAGHGIKQYVERCMLLRCGATEEKNKNKKKS